MFVSVRFWIHFFSGFLKIAFLVQHLIILMFKRRYGNSTIQTLLAAKEGPSQGGSSQRITIVPPLSAAWFSDIVIPAVIVSIVVVVSLFAIVVLLLLRRHIHLDGHEGIFYIFNPLTPFNTAQLLTCAKTLACTNGLEW